jgi:primosomal protein N'
VTGEEKAEVEMAAQKLASELAKADGEGIAMILGPVPTALPRFRGEYRYQLIVKATEEDALGELVLPVVEKLKKDRKSNVKYQLALNPTNIV